MRTGDPFLVSYKSSRNGNQNEKRGHLLESTPSKFIVKIDDLNGFVVDKETLDVYTFKKNGSGLNRLGRASRAECDGVRVGLEKTDFSDRL